MTNQVDLVDCQGLLIHHNTLHKPLDPMNKFIGHHNHLQRIGQPAFQVSDIMDQVRTGHGFGQQRERDLSGGLLIRHL